MPIIIVAVGAIEPAKARIRLHGAVGVGSDGEAIDPVAITGRAIRHVAKAVTTSVSKTPASRGSTPVSEKGTPSDVEDPVCIISVGAYHRVAHRIGVIVAPVCSNKKNSQGTQLEEG